MTTSGKLWQRFCPPITVYRRWYRTKVYMCLKDNMHFITNPNIDVPPWEGGGIVWDIGCNVGLWSVATTKRGNSLIHTKVVALDISSKAHRLLKRTVEKNNLYNIIPVLGAIHVDSLIYSFSPCVSSHTENTVSPGSHYSVSYQNFALEFGIPRCIKMDIEGYEKMFLESTSWRVWILSNKIRWYVEVHGHNYPWVGMKRLPSGIYYV
jgi:FkbM family methyltransferase